MQGNGLSVLKEGEKFFVVNPATRDISHPLGLEELTSALQSVKGAAAAEGRLALNESNSRSGVEVEISDDAELRRELPFLKKASTT